MTRKQAGLIYKILISCFYCLGIFILVYISPSIWRTLTHSMGPSPAFFTGYVIFNVLTAVPYFFFLYSLWRLIQDYCEDTFITETTVNRMKRLSILSLTQFLLYLLHGLFLIAARLQLPSSLKIFIIVVLLVASLLTLTCTLLSVLLKDMVALKEEGSLTI